MLIVESSSLDVYRNLALEEYLIDTLRNSAPILFLWRSLCAVVIGKNQNPWLECRLDLMQKEGVVLARRISGGGAVYHDKGNLNYCVITDRGKYREKQAYEMVCKALKTFGIHAEKTGKSSLSKDGLKFSGNAFAFRRGRVLHHGTLLLSADLERLNRYRGAMFRQIETHAAVSVPVPVANLALPVGTCATALKASFCSLYHTHDGGIRRCSERDFDAAQVCRRRLRQRSDEWIYGTTPKFRVQLNDRSWEVVKGVVINGDEKGRAFKDAASAIFTN